MFYFITLIVISLVFIQFYSSNSDFQGVGRVRVEPHPNVTVDVFVTHTCAEDYNFWFVLCSSLCCMHFVHCTLHNLILTTWCTTFDWDYNYVIVCTPMYKQRKRHWYFFGCVLPYILQLRVNISSQVKAPQFYFQPSGIASGRSRSWWSLWTSQMPTSFS